MQRGWGRLDSAELRGGHVRKRMEQGSFHSRLCQWKRKSGMKVSRARICQQRGAITQQTLDSHAIEAKEILLRNRARIVRTNGPNSPPHQTVMMRILTTQWRTNPVYCSHCSNITLPYLLLGTRNQSWRSMQSMRCQLGLERSSLRTIVVWI